MPPKKRSIRDFFTPAQSAAPTSQTPTAPLPAPRVPRVPRVPSPTATRSEKTNPTRHSSPPLPSIPKPAIGDVIHVATSWTTTQDIQHPPTSQSSANSVGTSKRVLSNGEPMVLNSDSDSDSLPEFDFGEPAKTAESTHTTSKGTEKKFVRNEVLRKPPSKRKEGKSFSLFVQKAQQHAETEREIAQYKADLEKPIEKDLPSADLGISEQVLADAVNDGEDPDKARRLYLAMQRINALHSECVFHFFIDARRNSPKSPSFPMHSLPNHQWTSGFQEKSSRDQAFLSGFAERVFRYQQLPDELVSWLIDEVCISGNDHFNEKYIHLLKEHDNKLHTLLNKNKLDALFNRLGADPQSLDPLLDATPSYAPHPAPTRSLPHSLKWVCRLLENAAPRLQTTVASHAIYILLLLCMDHSVISDVEMARAVQEATEAVLCRTVKLPSLLSDVVPLLLRRVRHPVLQRNLVRNMPARSPLAAYFQRYLAFSFLLYPRALDTALDSSDVASLLHSHLDESSDFRINKDSDYTFLSARVTLLDIAVGPGLLQVPYYPLTSPATSELGSSPVTIPGPQSSEEKAFNAEVDALVQLTKRLSSSIVETGAMSDLSRLEAKDYSERLYRRLENAVRIGGKKLMDIFGKDDEPTEARMMNKWLGSGSKSGSRTLPVMRGLQVSEVESSVDVAIET